MFETVDHAEISLPDPFRIQGERAWSYVVFPLHVPWFHLVYRYPIEGGGSLRRPVFLSRAEQLLEFNNDRVALDEAQIVLPGRFTGSDRWTMEPLAEVWEGAEPTAPGQRAYIYVLANGTRYLDSGLSRCETELRDRRLLFKRT